MTKQAAVSVVGIWVTAVVIVFGDQIQEAPYICFMIKVTNALSFGNSSPVNVQAAGPCAEKLAEVEGFVLKLYIAGFGDDLS